MVPDISRNIFRGAANLHETVANFVSTRTVRKAQTEICLIVDFKMKLAKIAVGDADRNAPFLKVVKQCIMAQGAVLYNPQSASGIPCGVLCSLPFLLERRGVVNRVQKLSNSELIVSHSEIDYISSLTHSIVIPPVQPSIDLERSFLFKAQRRKIPKIIPTNPCRLVA